MLADSPEMLACSGANIWAKHNIEELHDVIMSLMLRKNNIKSLTKRPSPLKYILFLSQAYNGAMKTWSVST